MNLKYSDLTGNIIGAAMEVHSYLGSGFQEVIYQRALSYEMQLRKIPHRREVEMEIFYKEKNVGTRRVDFLVYDKISVEIKAVSQMEPAHMTQAINYLEAYNLEIGLLINFGETKLKFHRVENRKLS
ncbi:MAG: GxxExxY protein [Leptospiraceae bacterium]|nr:GxxExxY protein [Leptospiraceae bacterium]